MPDETKPQATPLWLPTGSIRAFIVLLITVVTVVVPIILVLNPEIEFSGTGEKMMYMLLGFDIALIKDYFESRNGGA